MITLNDILYNISLPELTLTKKALSPDKWDMDTMLEAVRRIGLGYDPRFVLDKDNTEVYVNLVYWMMNDPRMEAIDPRTGSKVKGRLGKGIYLAGNTGSGKTVAMHILMKLYARNPFYGADSRAISWSEMRADEMTDRFAVSGDMEPFKRAQFLCIQDLGCEQNETLYMGNRVRVMQNVIEYRGDRKDFVTMATSNIPMAHEDLRARYGERATSRMMEMMNYLTLTGKDRRHNF